MEDRDMILVSLVKQYPHLYDRNSSCFKDKTIVENSWKAISLTLKTNVDDCQRRWYVLRNRYAKERRESDNPDPTKKQWPLMNAMSFLEIHVKRRRSFRAMGINELNFQNDHHHPHHMMMENPVPSKTGKWEEIIIEEKKVLDDVDPKYLHSDQSNASSYYDDEEDVIAIKSPPSKPINESLGNIQSATSSVSDSGYTEDSSSTKTNINIATTKNTSDNNITPPENDSNMHFCLSLHAPLQKIPKHLLTRAKIEILQVLDKYENMK